MAELYFSQLKNNMVKLQCLLTLYNTLYIISYVLASIFLLEGMSVK